MSQLSVGINVFIDTIVTDSLRLSEPQCYRDPPGKEHRMETEIRTRAADSCELCGSAEKLSVWRVEPARDGAEYAALVCDVCRAQLADEQDVDPGHFQHALMGAIWSEVPAVQVLSWRLLHRFDAPWARDLLEQAYLIDEVREWAEAGLSDEPEDHRPPAYDSNGTPLADGDSVTLIKDLDVKGAGFTAKRGTLVKGIRLTDNPDEVDARVNRVAIVLRTEFLKKA